jgi:hypothetical protein
MAMRSARCVLVLCMLGAFTVAPRAIAQQAVEYPAACDASKVSNADVERAHTVFLSGKQFLEESNYDKAIGYFLDAYSIDCSRHGILPIIATAYERKGDKAEAVRALEEYLRRAPEAPEHDVIERRIRNLKEQIAREPSAPAPASSAAPVASASAPPAPPPAPSVEAPPPSPPPASTPPQPEGHGPLPWVVVGVGGAAVVAGVVLMALGASDVSSALGTCHQVRNPCSSQSAVDQGNSGRTLEDVGGGVLAGGLVVAAAGVLWHFLEGPRVETGTAPVSGRAQIVPAIRPGYEGVSLRASF